MKGKLWELGPFVLAALAGLYYLAGRLPRPREEPPKPRGGLPPRPSAGPGDPTKPEDFMPDPDSKPDPRQR